MYVYDPQLEHTKTRNTHKEEEETTTTKKKAVVKERSVNAGT
jgi:hypothetical protein